MQKGTISKYRPFHKRFQVKLPDRTWPERTIDSTPIWCSVDLRDGNQALATPMTVEEKLEMFKMLVAIGFKEIEVGFPSASDTEFAFCRKLIEDKLIPADVSIQVLVQAREHLIRRTFEAIDGAPSAIVHLYNSTSPLQRKVTFNDSSKEQIRDIATEGTKLVSELVATIPNTNVRFQYSPESFSDTELDYALEVCEAVMSVWLDAHPERNIILNLPATVEWATPNVHADQIEWFCRKLKETGRREKVIVSLHTHNDRGTGIAATELGLLAGADRVEGTLFGNGERTGNLDIVIVAMNLYTQGVDPKLNFDDIEAIREVYERCTRMTVPERWPYSGELVFTAFSGSHQDAIKKGMDRIAQKDMLRKKEPTELSEAEKRILGDIAQTDGETSSADSPSQRGEEPLWEVPYLTIDPKDIGRTYEAIIRINSQSGKGGVAYVLGREFGLDLPKSFHPTVGNAVNAYADSLKRELTAQEIHDYFTAQYVNLDSPLKLLDHDVYPSNKEKHTIACVARVEFNGKGEGLEGVGNGPISAFVNAMDHEGWKDFKLLDYRSHAIGAGSGVDSAAYIQIQRLSDGKSFWGVGIDPSIETAGILALICAYNRSVTA